jgi:hypothetical protein
VLTGTTVSVTTLPPATGATTADTGAGGGALTTATIPGFDPNSTTTSAAGGSSNDEASYVRALNNLDTVLSYTDSRVPELATEINNTAPGVPGWVDEELGRLQQDVENAQDELGSQSPPQRFQRAGTVTAGKSYFDAGRQARDQYRRFFDQYRSARP